MARRSLLALILFTCTALRVGRSYPVGIIDFESFTKAPVFVTAKVEQASRDELASQPGQRDRAHAQLVVLRCFPDAVLRSGQRINLVYMTLPEAVTQSKSTGLDIGSVYVFPLQLNKSPDTDSWHMVVDEGIGHIIPAAQTVPEFGHSAGSGREFVLREIASVLNRGTPDELAAESMYLGMQQQLTPHGTTAFSPDLLRLTTSAIGDAQDRRAVIAASLLVGLGTPRPTVAELRAGTGAAAVGNWPGSFLVAVLQKLGASSMIDQRLAHDLFLISERTGGAGASVLAEFAGNPEAIQELRERLKSLRPGALYVARVVLNSGPTAIRADALAAAWRYIEEPGSDRSDFNSACALIRDYGDDEQFNRLVQKIKDAEYQNQRFFDMLWSAILYSESPREKPVIEILMKDPRSVSWGPTYATIAANEASRLQALHGPGH